MSPKFSVPKIAIAAVLVAVLMILLAVFDFLPFDDGETVEVQNPETTSSFIVDLSEVKQGDVVLVREVSEFHDLYYARRFDKAESCIILLVRDQPAMPIAHCREPARRAMFRRPEAVINGNYMLLTVTLERGIAQDTNCVLILPLGPVPGMIDC